MPRDQSLQTSLVANLHILISHHPPDELLHLVGATQVGNCLVTRLADRYVRCIRRFCLLDCGQLAFAFGLFLSWVTMSLLPWT